MFSQVVVLLFLCCFYVNCVSAESPDIEELKSEIIETKAAIVEVQEENSNLEQQISDLELDFKKNVTELQAQYTNVSEEVLKDTAKTTELYMVLTNFREMKRLLETEINELQNWIEVRKLSIMFINQDLKVYNRRINNGSAEECLKFQEPLVLLVDRFGVDDQSDADDDQDRILMLQNELNQARTMLSYVSSVKNELQMILEDLTHAYKLKIGNLLELLERNMGDEEHVKETVKKFETEVMELSNRISELKAEKSDLKKEREKIEHDVDNLRVALLKITQETACFQKLEQLVLNTNPVPSVDIPVTAPITVTTSIPVTTSSK